MLFVHAHPDDETITTGGTIATLIERGAGVTVLHCTRGERGEVIPPELHSLEGDLPALAAYREGELRAAMGILGVTDQRFLGAPEARVDGSLPRRYVDSGMRWGVSGAEAPKQLDPQSLCAAQLGEVAADVATVIQQVSATRVVSYDAHGGYGHPDHIRAHDAARRAADVMGVPFYAVVAEGAEALSDDIVVDVSAALARKTDALRAHRTQVTVERGSFALSSGPFRPIVAQESFRRIVRPEPRSEGTATWSDLGVTGRVVAGVLAFVVGLALGGIGTVNHQLVLGVAGLRLPGGVTVALLLVLALMLGLRLVFRTRVIPLVSGLGILAAMGILTIGGPGGSVLVPANAAGYAWTYGAAAIVVLVLVWPRIVVPAARTVDTSPRDTMEASHTTRGTTAQ
ncbi:PIG-L family deacetylase [Parafrigoribacterium soli]|uniref:PIG-L family deacetylase n=1 Tax=Parafrigoribacterium soli TaxID=3144663 RepID=UPI0032EC43AF